MARCTGPSMAMIEHKSFGLRDMPRPLAGSRTEQIDHLRLLANRRKKRLACWSKTDSNRRSMARKHFSLRQTSLGLRNYERPLLSRGPPPPTTGNTWREFQRANGSCGAIIRCSGRTSDDSLQSDGVTDRQVVHRPRHRVKGIPRGEASTDIHRLRICYKSWEGCHFFFAFKTASCPQLDLLGCSQ
jgi:hypothetical protein